MKLVKQPWHKHAMQRLASKATPYAGGQLCQTFQQDILALKRFEWKRLTIERAEQSWMNGWCVCPGRELPACADLAEGPHLASVLWRPFAEDPYLQRKTHRETFYYHPSQRHNHGGNRRIITVRMKQVSSYRKISLGPYKRPLKKTPFSPIGNIR